MSGIRGNIRHNRIRCIGEPGHSGAVPRAWRKDAVFAVSSLVTKLDAYWWQLLIEGTDIVLTAGVVETNPAEHAVSRIPGEVSFSFEIRSDAAETLEAAYQHFRQLCNEVSASYGVRFEFDQRMFTAPAKMNEDMLIALQSAARRLNQKLPVIASGAGHDASVFANAGIPSAMIFIRNENGSHNPAEAMEMEDFFAGVELLHETVLELQYECSSADRNMEAALK